MWYMGVKGDTMLKLTCCILTEAFPRLQIQSHYRKHVHHLSSVTPMKTVLCSFQTRVSSSSSRSKTALITTEAEIEPKKAVFDEVRKKDKETFLKIIKLFKGEDKKRRGHVEFIFAALKYIEEFNAQYDLETYKKLMDVFPKGKMMPKNLVQAEFFHFPRHQECGIFLLDHMERHGVYPDKEMKEIILNVFGHSSHVYKKYCRMMYWMSKLKNANPYMLPTPLPSDVEQLALLAMKKMSVDPRTEFTHFKAKDLEDSLDKTWIVSAQSPAQRKLLKSHLPEKPLYVEGTFLVWLNRLSLSYFVLRADPVPRPKVDEDEDDVSNLSLYMFGEPKPKKLVETSSSVHEQEDGTIYGMCATGTSSKDSVLSWIRFLRESNPVLDNLSILFKLKSAPTALTNVNAPNERITVSPEEEPIVEEAEIHKR